MTGRRRQFCVEPTDEYPITVEHCQAIDWVCDRAAEVFCLCGCERQICRECAWREFQARQARMAQNMIRHSPDREAVIVARLRIGDRPRPGHLAIGGRA